MMSNSAGDAPSTSTVSDSLPRARATSACPSRNVGTITCAPTSRMAVPSRAMSRTNASLSGLRRASFSFGVT